MSTRALRELLEFAKPSKVERLENGAIVLRRVKYLGARSANVNPDGTQNVYTTEARRKSERLYDGVKLFADHPERTNPNRERSIREQLGRLRGPFEHTADGSYADAYLNPKHPLAESIAWSAEYSPDDLGLSHNAQGRGRVRGTDCLIEDITHARSVDFVCAAATTRGLYEGRTEDSMLTKERLAELREAAATKAKLAEKQKALMEAVDEAALLAILADGALPAEEKVMQALAMLASAATGAEAPAEGGEAGGMEGKKPAESGDPKLVESLQVKVAALEARIAAEETQKRRDALLVESKLPITDGLRALVRGAESDDRAKALVEEVKRAAFHQSPTSGGRASVAPAAGDQIKSVDDFVGALR